MLILSKLSTRICDHDSQLMRNLMFEHIINTIGYWNKILVGLKMATWAIKYVQLVAHATHLTASIDDE